MVGTRTEQCNAGNRVILVSIDAVGRVSTNSNWLDYTEEDRNADADERRPPISTRAGLAKLYQFLKTYCKSPEDGQSEDVYIYRC